MLDTALIALLETAATSAGDRIRPIRLDQDETYPAATVQLISQPKDDDHDGPLGESTARYQITSWSPIALEALTLADEIEAELHGYTGALGAYTVAYVAAEGGPNLFDSDAGPIERGGAVGLFQCPRDYMIQLTEA